MPEPEMWPCVGAAGAAGPETLPAMFVGDGGSPMIHPRAVWRPYAVIQIGPRRYRLLCAEMLNLGSTLVYAWSGHEEYQRKSDAVAAARYHNDQMEAALKVEQLRCEAASVG